MKWIYILLIAMITALPIGHAGDSRHQLEYDYEGEEEFSQLANYSALGTSMVGWGIGMAIVSAVIAAVIKPSTEEKSPEHKHAHAHCD